MPSPDYASPRFAGSPIHWCVVSICGKALLLSALLVVVGGARSEAQPSESCDSLLARAQEHYVDQQFAEATAAARSCLARSNRTLESAIASHRLLALVALRQDDLTKAKGAVIELLSVSFDYSPDPIFDPPTYASLVDVVRSQLQVVAAVSPLLCEGSTDTPLPGESAFSEALVDEEIAVASGSAQEPLRSARSIHVGLTLGAGSYSGERGINAPSLIGEFNENGGFSVALDGTYYLENSFAVAASYRTVRFPLLLSNDVRVEDVQVRPNDSSEWVHMVSVLGRVVYQPKEQVAPYAQIGIGGIFSYLNKVLGMAAGPQLGVGIDVAATPRLAGFAEFNVLVAVPGYAVDRVNANGAFGDILTFAGVGVRYRL